MSKIPHDKVIALVGASDWSSALFQENLVATAFSIYDAARVYRYQRMKWLYRRV
jgi:hypothetical protein